MLTYLNLNQLKIHPQNMRQFYPDADVAEMAASIQAIGGVLQALLVVPSGETPNGHGPTYHVVDGNMRLTAARTIPDCPPLKCEIIDSNQAEQLLVMTATSAFHYPKDHISEAIHYQRLIQQEGYTVLEISAAVGVSNVTIYGRLSLLDLDDDIQSLIIQGKIPSGDAAPLRHLMKIPEKTTRIALARRFAAQGASNRQMRKSVAHVLKQYQQIDSKPTPPSIKTRRKPVPVAAGQLDVAAIMKIAETTLCDECRLNGLTDKCWVCPGPYDFINAVVEKAEFQMKKEETNGQAETNGSQNTTPNAR